MPTKALNIKHIAAKNARVNSKQLAEALSVISKLRESGLTAPKYELSLPFSRRFSHADCSEAALPQIPEDR